MSDEDFLKEMESSDSTSTNQGELDNEDRNLHEQTSSLSGSSGQEQSDDAEGDDGSVTGEHSEQSLDDEEQQDETINQDESNVFEDGDEPDEEDDDESGNSADDDSDNADNDDDDSDDDSSNASEYEEFYKLITAPFKANGRELTVSSAEEVISLMQKGANYHKKMAALKPNITLLKMLENNGLLDEAKLSHLIDLSKGDQKAIAKLMKDGDISALDIEKEDAEDYSPSTYTVDDAQLELDEVISDLKDTDSLARTLDVINNKWDKKSQEAVLAKPADIRIINEHIASGAFDHISDIVERERMKGELTNLTDIEAYITVANNLQAQLQQQAEEKAKQERAKQAVKQKNDAIKAKRKKVSSPTKGKPSSAPIEEDFNVLNMSDEEFLKFSQKL